MTLQISSSLPKVQTHKSARKQFAGIHDFTSKMSKAVRHNLSSEPPRNPEVELKELTISQSVTDSDCMGNQIYLGHEIFPAAEMTTK